jgi:hypothetical protein
MLSGFGQGPENCLFECQADHGVLNNAALAIGIHLKGSNT